MRRTDIMRNILKKAKTDEIFMLDDWDGNTIGVVIRHHFPSPHGYADWANPTWTDDEVFKITPPKRFR